MRFFNAIPYCSNELNFSIVGHYSIREKKRTISSHKVLS